MAEYKAIHGTTVSNRTSDPLAAGTANGTWASGGNLNQIKGRPGFASNATSTTHVALVYGGNTPGKTANTEQYDGSSWTELANLNTARNGYGGSGTLTAAGYAGGEIPSNPYNTDAFELWDGSSWSETTEINTARRSIVGFGATNTASLVASGYVGAASDLTEVWNGSSWTEVAEQNAAKYGRGGTGTVTAGILFGGTDPTTNTETWNGTAWTEVSELNTKGEYRAASGTAAEVLAVGGYQATANVELWNGSAWTEINNISTARWEGAGTGSSSLGMISGGNTPPNTAATEEFTAATIADSILNDGQVFYRSDTGDMKVSLTAFGTGAWASGGTMNTSRKMQMGFGIQTANIMAGGAIPPPAATDATEQYNGTAWSEIAEINTARRNGKGAGTVTAGLVFGGYDGPGSGTGANEAWNGSAWTEVGDLSRSGGHQSFGTAGASSTSAIIFAGEPGTLTITETWNGTAWTEVADLNSGRSSTAGFGETTAALCVSGYAPSGGSYPTIANVEKFDGTSWTEINDVNTSRGGGAGGSGSSTSGLFFGGQSPAGQFALTETFNGTSFTEVGDLSGPIYEMGYAPLGASSQSNLAGMSAGGKSPSPGSVAVTEEWTIPESISNLTITD